MSNHPLNSIVPAGEKPKAAFDDALAVYETIGTCSLCGGPVLHGLTKKTRKHRPDHCGDCGATVKGAHGPIISMEQRPGSRLDTSPEPVEWR